MGGRVRADRAAASLAIERRLRHRTSVHWRIKMPVGPKLARFNSDSSPAIGIMERFEPLLCQHLLDRAFGKPVPWCAQAHDAQETTRDRVSNFIQTPVGQRAHPSRIMEGAMHDSQRYRDSAAERLLAAEEACQPYYRRLHLSMAASWLSLARQDEAIDNLFASWDTDKPIREPAIGRH